MKLLSKFDPVNWNTAFGTVRLSHWLIHKNSQISMNDTAVEIHHGKEKIQIPLQEIESVGFQKFIFPPSIYLGIRLKSLKEVRLLVPNPDFYLNWLLTKCPHVKMTHLRTKLFVSVISHLLVVIPTFFIFFHREISASFRELLPQVSLVSLTIEALLLINVFLLLRVLNIRRKLSDVPTKKLMTILWTIPLLGSFLVSLYLRFFDVNNKTGVKS